MVLYHAGAEVGQGAHTVLAQMAAEAAEVDISRVETHYSDTAHTGDSGSGFRVTDDLDGRQLRSRRC